MVVTFLIALGLASSGLTDTVVVLGRMEHDLTGDGRPEVLRLIGSGRSLDSLDITFSITSAGTLLYQLRLAPLTRVPGYDRHLGQATRAQHRARVDSFGTWFFAESRFKDPPEFVAAIRDWTPHEVERIPEVIARDCAGFSSFSSQQSKGLSGARAAGPPLHGRSDLPCDISRASKIWEEIQRSGVTIFDFSPGGDGATAIGWSDRDQRFYHLWECC